MPPHVLPPSSEICPGLPPTKIFWSLVGSMRIWLKYMGRWFWLLMNFQVLPPSSERNTPLALGFGGPVWPPRPPPPPPPPPACPPAAAPAPAPAGVVSVADSACAPPPKPPRPPRAGPPSAAVPP